TMEPYREEADLVPTLPPLVLDHLDIFVCPACRGSLRVGEGPRRVACATCARSFGCDQGIPLFFWPTEWTGKSDVTEIVKTFYEATPFPNYDDMDSTESLRAK